MSAVDPIAASTFLTIHLLRKVGVRVQVHNNLSKYIPRLEALLLNRR